MKRVKLYIIVIVVCAIAGGVVFWFMQAHEQQPNKPIGDKEATINKLIQKEAIDTRFLNTAADNVPNMTVCELFGAKYTYVLPIFESAEKFVSEPKDFAFSRFGNLQISYRVEHKTDVSIDANKLLEDKVDEISGTNKESLNLVAEISENPVFLQSYQNENDYLTKPNHICIYGIYDCGNFDYIIIQMDVYESIENLSQAEIDALHFVGDCMNTDLIFMLQK